MSLLPISYRNLYSFPYRLPGVLGRKTGPLPNVRTEWTSTVDNTASARLLIHKEDKWSPGDGPRGRGRPNAKYVHGFGGVRQPASRWPIRILLGRRSGRHQPIRSEPTWMMENGGFNALTKCITKWRHRKTKTCPQVTHNQQAFRAQDVMTRFYTPFYIFVGKSDTAGTCNDMNFVCWLTCSNV